MALSASSFCPSPFEPPLRERSRWDAGLSFDINSLILLRDGTSVSEPPARGATVRVSIASDLLSRLVNSCYPRTAVVSVYLATVTLTTCTDTPRARRHIRYLNDSMRVMQGDVVEALLLEVAHVGGARTSQASIYGNTESKRSRHRLDG